ncbi:4Fe-4S dicluster domain-containing protein [Desulforhopalus singaporensis]|uniref:Fe-S-cluster-containing dehydrogenase component n=1 Tax=Desulforhopalus singaporensis TaxID=91360 RepID=A0A1H0PWF7_9BACT|nr:4Fe-4S dicluster domain-containing protein [Desulforhopalus singaporensis]SDP09507.1 Fe-S-cluster-containing dehydrogenase component [Desulforhopalus singaporensis]
MQYGMIIDLERCVGCHACTIACKAEWEVPVEFNRNWVYRMGPSKVGNEIAATYYPGLCNHCTEPVCVPECPADTEDVTFTDPKTGKTVTMEVAATWKDPFDGTVQVDKNRCIGCGACADACPYNARYVNPDLTDDVSEDGKVDKCTYCQPRLQAGLEPACVQTCITGARIFGDLDDPNSEVAKYVKKGAKGLEAEGGDLGPNSRYIGKKKDMALLFNSYTPELADMNKVRRRAMIASLVKPAVKQLQGLGLLGAAGILVAKKLSEDK